MVTTDPEPPPWHEDLPCFFKTRRAARAWAEGPNTREWLDLDDDTRILVLPGPDDVTVKDIEWDDYA